MANKTTKELEELAVELMVTRKLTPKDALDEAVLNYEPALLGTTEFLAGNAAVFMP